jgi:5-methylcytosine-specific restriction endonuclease McrA|tara:strand:- start:18 stop:455 length:438 start_codon:yes stop_codon:yes gene_type:complete
MKYNYCKFCGQEIRHKKYGVNYKQYCNNKCQRDHNYQSYIKEWLEESRDGSRGNTQISQHIRRWMHERANDKCEKCGWNEWNKFTNKVPLQVNHIDGNALNHRPENLELICPNCHSLTETYGYTGARVSARRGQRKQQYSNLARP